eukprot:TRINITY_DN4716_c0_g1_i17.p1 TRINITY_DN4716_c0_g1~~TRINITY_DN4716_c0_g1_i17.p1  ORF type:complete len:577 (+),score=95.12 TRINITY_DN4716_c0_g1_i17:87-1817(+)
MAKRTKLSSSWISRFEKIEIDVPVNRDFFNASGEEISVWLSRLASGQIPLTGNPSFPVFPDVPTVALLQEAIAAAAAGGQLYWLQHLLQHEEMTAVGRQKALLAASRHGQLGAVELLLQHGGVDASAQRNAALRSAARGGHELVVSCLLEAGGVDASACGNAALIEAAANGHVATVHRLLKAPNVSVRARHQLAFRSAAAGGHLALVKYLLRQRYVNPTAHHNDAILSAIRRGHTAIVAELLDYSLIRKDQNLHLRLLDVACGTGNAQIVDLLLMVLPQLPESGDYAFVRTTLNEGHLHIFRRLLLHFSPTRVTRFFNECLACICRIGSVALFNLFWERWHMQYMSRFVQKNMLCALEGGHLALLERMLSVFDFHPDDEFVNTGLIAAVKSADPAIVDFLLRNYLVLPSSSYQAFELAVKNSAEPLIQIFENYINLNDFLFDFYRKPSDFDSNEVIVLERLFSRPDADLEALLRRVRESGLRFAFKRDYFEKMLSLRVFKSIQHIAYELIRSLPDSLAGVAAHYVWPEYEVRRRLLEAKTFRFWMDQLAALRQPPRARNTIDNMLMMDFCEMDSAS